MPKNLSKKIESILFVAARPLSVQKIADIVKAGKKEVSYVLNELQSYYAAEDRGMRFVKSGTTWQMVTDPQLGTLVASYIKDEVAGELTKPSLEALAIIAYRGPITKAEVEQIRGVNCSLIIRNLLIRGFIAEAKEKGAVVPSYQVTVDLLKYLGVSRVSELPEYEKLHKHVALESFLDNQNSKR